MNDIVAIHKFVVDGDDAEKLYDIFRNSYLNQSDGVLHPYKGCSVHVDFSYEDGVLRIEEKSPICMSYVAEVLFFFADLLNIYSMSEYIEDGVTQSYDVCDSDGKYFVRPPMTEWELRMEEKMNACTDLDDLPF